MDAYSHSARLVWLCEQPGCEEIIYVFTFLHVPSHPFVPSKFPTKNAGVVRSFRVAFVEPSLETPLQRLEKYVGSFGNRGGWVLTID